MYVHLSLLISSLNLPLLVKSLSGARECSRILRHVTRGSRKFFLLHACKTFALSFRSTSTAAARLSGSSHANMLHRRIETTRSAAPKACTCIRNTRRPLHQRYWQLPCPVHTSATSARPTIKKLNFKYPQRVKKEKAIKFHRRAECGLIAYETCTADELGSFVRSRGLDGSGTRLTQKSQLIPFLERADEATSFDRFMDLPPELRITVYSCHFGSFEAATPEPPPLLAVSRRVRQEARPIFYEQTRFIIKVEHSMGGGPRPDRPTTKLFERLDPDNLGRINKLRVRWAAFGGPFITTWDVDLLQDDDASMLRSISEAPYNRNDVFRCKRQRENAFTRLLEVLKSIQAKPTRQKMQQRDLHWIVAAFL